MSETGSHTMPAGPSAQATAWADATLVAALCAIDPTCGGASVRAGAGPVRDEWLALNVPHLNNAMPMSIRPPARQAPQMANMNV